jgi:hypothetical protein
MSIEEVRRSGQRKNLKRWRKKIRIARGGRVVCVQEWGLGAKIYGVKA